MPDFPKPYWAEWSDRIISRYDLREGPKGEFHGSCPHCGHNDWPSTRFWINEKDGMVKFNCRQCNDFTSIVQILEEDGVWPVAVASSKAVNVGVTASDFDNIVQMPKPAIKEKPPEQFDPFTPYHERKGVELIGAVLEKTDVVVKLYNTERQQVGQQRIQPNGDKRFNTGLNKEGGVFGVVGRLNPDNPGTVWLAEGWATCVSVHMALDKQLPVIFALDKNNIQTVVDALTLQWPDIDIRIAADNDANNGGQEAAQKTGLPWTSPALPDTDWNDVHAALGLSAVKQGLTQLKSPESLLDELVWIGDAAPVLKSNYLIKGWIGRQQMAVLYGQSNTGKSFLMLDMAYHVAAGRPWHENKVQQGVVLYLAAEGGHGYLNRAKAIADHYGDTDVPLAVRPCPVNLLDPEADLPKLRQLIDLVNDKHGKIELIIVDTLSRALAGGNENGPEDMTAYISNADALRDHAQATVVTVHHSGKADNGARGHSSLRAATDTEIELRVDEDAGIRFAKATKQRDIESGKEFAFELKSVELGCDEDGDPVTSCYITPADDERVSEATTKVSQNERLLLNCFTQLWGEQIGGPNPGGVGYPESGTRWVINEQQLRDHFYGKLTVSNKSQAWKRAVDGMLGKGEIAVNDGFFWLVRQKYKL